MGSQQIAVRLSEESLAKLDEMVAEGAYESRASAVRAGIDILTEQTWRQGVDRLIQEGYRRIPPTAAEDDAAVASLREAIAEEPW